MFTTTTKTNTTTEDRNPTMIAFDARCREIVETAAARMTAMVRELSDIAEAAGETANNDLMYSAMECRAALIRAIKGDAAIEREVSAAWASLGADLDGRIMRRALGAAIATIATEMSVDTVPGAFMFGGDHTAVTGYGGRKGLDPKAIARTVARKRKSTGKAKGSRRGGK